MKTFKILNDCEVNEEILVVVLVIMLILVAKFYSVMQYEQTLLYKH